jgi:hypothetical protein
MNSSIIVLGGSLILIGVLISSVILISPIHRWSRVNYRRKLLMCIIIASITSIALQFYETHESAKYLVYMGLPLKEGERQIYESAVVNEVWMRLIVPPASKQSCYVHKQEICSMSDRTISWTSADHFRDVSFRDENWLDYLSYPAIYLIFTFIGCFLVIILLSSLIRMNN